LKVEFGMIKASKIGPLRPFSCVLLHNDGIKRHLKEQSHIAFEVTQEKIQSQVGMIEPWKIGSLRPIWCLLSHNGIKRHLEEGQLEVRSQKKC